MVLHFEFSGKLAQIKYIQEHQTRLQSKLTDIICEWRISFQKSSLRLYLTSQETL